ncbi:MAG: NADH-quinone oxidoreductase subunit M [Alphaproteobacteria bacterium GM7ARS4]|nr:NADH-quinone oxidoreductase subunit M [Alphaproteobacteria bacterium GM7ARS4]
MTFVDFPILSVLIFLPLVTALFIILVRGREARVASNTRFLALWGATAHLGLSCVLAYAFDSSQAGYQFVETLEWFAPFSIGYHVGVDGISLGLVVLTSFLTWASLLASRAMTYRVKEYLVAFMVLESFTTGALLSLDLIPFYIFFEAVLVPMFFIIGIWGGERRIYATFKFFLYTLTGSLLFFVAILVLYQEIGTTDMILIGRAGVPESLQYGLWLAFFASFAVKLPMWPVHSWLPLAHVEAPAAGSMLLAGILLKLGAYGFMRLSLPLFPDASLYFAPMMYVLSIIAIIYTSLVAWQQTDMKRLIAYASIAHMGYVTLGIFSFTEQGMQGALMQMVSHGVISAALFMGIGLLYEQTHSRAFSVYGGVAKVMPLFGVMMMVYTLGSVGLPGTSGFIGEFMTLHGVWEAHWLWAALAASGVVLSAMYMLAFYRRVFFGEVTPQCMGLSKVALIDACVLWMWTLLIVGLGVYPLLYLELVQEAVSAFTPLFDRASVIRQGG